MVLAQTHNTPRQCVQKSLLNSYNITGESFKEKYTLYKSSVIIVESKMALVPLAVLYITALSGNGS